MTDTAFVDPAQIDYTDADYAAMRRRLINFAASQYPGWDTLGRHEGNLVLEAIAWAFDAAGVFTNNAALELFLPTARRRENLERLAALLAYPIRPRTAARHTVRVTLSAVPTNDVEIPVDHRFSTSGSGARIFTATAAVVIPAGTNPPVANVVVEDSTPREDAFLSTGLPDQRLTTTGRPLIDTLVVLADDGAYTPVDNFVFSGPTDRHVVIEVTSDQRAVLRFGDGAAGKVPQGTIALAYRIGGGLAGNVAAGTITTLDPLTDVLANPVGATCTNPNPAFVLGAERESIAEIRQNAPASVRVTDRTVTKEDYEIGAEQVSGVARALMLTSNEMPGTVPENTGYLYVVPADTSTPSADVLAAVLTQVTTTRPKTITFRCLVQPPVYRVVDLRAVVYFKPNVSPQRVKAAIVAELQSYFAPLLPDNSKNTRVGFGFDYDPATPALPLSTLLGVFTSQPGVARVGDRSTDFLIAGEHGDLELAAFEWPKLGEIVVVDGNTGQQVP